MHQLNDATGSITRRLAETAKKDSVLQELNELAMRVFNLKHTRLFLINEKENYHYNLTLLNPHTNDDDSIKKLSEQRTEGRIKHKGTIIEFHFELLKKNKRPMIFDLRKSQTSADGLALEQEYEECYTALVNKGNHTFGLLYLFSEQSSNLQMIDEALVMQVADLVAVALADIRFKEEILERDRQQTNLLSISESILQAKNAAALLKTIRNRAMELIHFDDAHITVIENDGLHHYNLAVSFQGRDAAESNKRLVSKGLIKTAHRGSYADSLMQLIQQKQSPVIEDYQLRYHEFDYPFFNHLEEMGFMESMVTVLSSGGKAFGLLFLNSLEKKHFNTGQFPLFQAIAQQVSVAVSNILASEEQIQREKEKTVLLNISNAVAKINSKENLLRSIDALLLPVFKHDDACFCIIDKEKKYFTDYYNLYSSLKNNPADKTNQKTEVYKHIYKTNDSTLLLAGSFVEYAMTKPAMSGKLTDIIPLSKYAEFVQSDIKAGLKYYSCAPLMVGGSPIGLFMLDFKRQHRPKEKDLQLFARIADILALAFANLLANEEIIEKEKEKSILLLISQQISQIRDLDTMVNWLQEEGNKMHQSDHMMIVLTSPKENTVSLILGKGDTGWQSVAGRKPRTGLVKMPTPYKGSIFEHIESLPEGTLYSAADFDLPETSNFCGREFKLAESFYVKLIHKGEPIGHVSFHTFLKGIFKNIDISLCRNFANQMAVSLMNILSNEAMLEKEKQKTFEIKINNAVLKNDRYEDVLKDVTESINAAVGCDICYIRIRSEEIDARPFNVFCMKQGNNYLVKSRESILKEMSVKHTDIEKDINDFFAALKGPLILTGTLLEEKQQQFNYLKAFKNTFNIQSFAFIPLHVKGNTKVQLILGSKKAYAYIDSDLDMINQVIPQLSLTLDNRFAFVQIQMLKEMLETENLYLQEEINDNYNFNEIVGSSEALQSVFRQASMVAGTDTTVLIGGETGTGKELLARAIHNLSSRKDKIMVKVNCACLPPQLIESELFGHEKGAFTGAVDKRIGKFELANGGTIFLDEIGELPLELQSKLLRVIQEREFERIGGRTTIKTDIRIIAATNKNLEIESNEKRFRSDLYYRLNVFPVVIPALRDRKEDIPLLALHFAKKFGLRMRKNITAVTNEALQEMMLYDWPGNIRELEHVIEHSVISSKSNKLALGRPLIANNIKGTITLSDFKLNTLDNNEREHIIAVLKYCNGRVRGSGGAAQILDIHPNTLESRMNKLGIKKELVFNWEITRE